MAAAPAVALAVVLVACGSEGGSREGDAADPAPQPSSPSSGSASNDPGGSPGSLPVGLRITGGMASSEDGAPARQREGGRGVGAVELCGEAALPPGEAAVRLTAAVSGPEYSDARELRRYPDVEIAQAAVADLLAVAEACPQDGEGGALSRNVVEATDAGEESYVVTQTYETDGMVPPGAVWWRVVRIGDAVLVTSRGAEYQPGPGLEEAQDEELTELEPTLAQMCVFAEDGCDLAGAPETLDATGYGDLVLGSSWEQAVASDVVVDPGVGPERGSACTALRLRVGGAVALADDAVVSISVPEGVTTAEGVGVGSGVDDLRAAYDDAEEGANGWSVPLEGGSAFTFLVDGDVVTDLTLVAEGDPCAG